MRAEFSKLGSIQYRFSGEYNSLEEVPREGLAAGDIVLVRGRKEHMWNGAEFLEIGEAEKGTEVNERH